MYAPVLLFAPTLFSLLVASSPVPQQWTAKPATRSTPFHDLNSIKAANPKTYEKIHHRQTDDVNVDVEAFNLKTRSTPFHNPNFGKPTNPKLFEKVLQRAQALDLDLETRSTPFRNPNFWKPKLPQIYQRAASTSASVPAPTATAVSSSTTSSASATVSAIATPTNSTDDVPSAESKDPYDGPNAVDDDDVVWIPDDEAASYADKREDKPASEDGFEDDVEYEYLYDEPETAADGPEAAPEANKTEVVSKREVDDGEEIEYLFRDAADTDDAAPY